MRAWVLSCVVFAACGGVEELPAARFVVDGAIDANDASAAHESLPPEAAHVAIGDHYFAPAIVRVRRGGHVTWTFGGSSPHTVTSRAGLFDSSPPRTGGTFSVTFATPGVYPYECLAPGSPMSGTVVVQ